MYKFEDTVAAKLRNLGKNVRGTVGAKKRKAKSLSVTESIPDIFHIYLLNMFHIFSPVCFLIYGVNRRQVLTAKPRLYALLRLLYVLLAILSFIIKFTYFSNKIVPLTEKPRFFEVV